MAGSGLYKSDVKKARDALIVQGKNPSVDAVRVELGNTGSKTTIHKYLKELKDEDGGAGGKRASISDALQDLVERLAGRLHEEAEEQVTAIRKDADAKIAEHEAAVLAAKQENGRMLIHLRETEAALEQQDAALAAAQEALQRESTARQVAERQTVDLKERLAENEAHRKSLEEKHQHAREAVEHYRDSIKEQREADARRHEQQVQQVQAELRLAQQTIAVKQEEATRLNREGAQLVAELTHTRHALSAEEERGRRQVQDLEGLRAISARHDVLTAQLIDKDKHVVDLRQQLGATAAKNDNLNNQVQALQHALATAQARVEAQEAIVTKLQPLLDAEGRRAEVGKI